MAVMDYRTQDGLADYGFSIEFYSDVGWRVYPIFQPFHQGHDDSLQLPYQSMDHNGRRYVNWSSKLNSLGDAKTVAGLWAELIHRYQRTQEQRKATPAGPDRLGDPVPADHGRALAPVGIRQADVIPPQQHMRCWTSSERVAT